eukprot:XP_014005298.1 PREDICTED: tctex1 domain-containing protein 2 isoform X1 [Salmo salar]
MLTILLRHQIRIDATQQKRNPGSKNTVSDALSRDSFTVTVKQRLMRESYQALLSEAVGMVNDDVQDRSRFKAAVVKECIRDILREQLSGVQYDPDEVGVLSRSLADCIKDKLKDVGFDRYKLVVQVVIGEQRGEGVNSLKGSDDFFLSHQDGCQVFLGC